MTTFQADSAISEACGPQTEQMSSGSVALDWEFKA
jgi:hypothetical protein